MNPLTENKGYQPSEITKEFIGKRLRTEDSPANYWVRVKSLKDGGFWCVDIYGKEIEIDNPRFRFYVIDENCTCDKLRDNVERNTGVLIACALHSFTGVKGLI